MKSDQEKIDLTINPITGFPNEGKRYYYPKGYFDNDNSEETDEDEPLKDGPEIDDAKLAMALERLRWRGARKIRGYRFKGTIPEPKNGTDYAPWLKNDD